MGFGSYREVIRQLLAYDDTSSTQLAPEIYPTPATHYTDAKQFELERRLLFRESPIVACHARDVADAGDFVTLECGGVPILVVRGRDATVQAFANICRHRASILVEGCGHVAQGFTCPFHSWTYGLDGSLRATPYAADGFAALEPERANLIPLPVAEARGLVFVRPVGGDAIDAESLLDGMGAEFDELGFGSFHYFDRWESRWRCNWKLILDTFLETYHVFALHRRSIARAYLVQPSMYEAFGSNLRFHSLQKSFLDLRDTPEAEWSLVPHGTIEYLVAPNTLLLHTVDHLAMYRLWPVSVDETIVELRMYTPTAVDSETDAAHYRRVLEMHQRVGTEGDFAQQEHIQRALASGVVSEVVFGRNEPAAIHVHQALKTRLGLAT